MSLIKCPEEECGNMVSDQAAICPKCGRRLLEAEYKIAEITFYESGRKSGSEEYRALLNDGWKVMDESRYDLNDPYGHCYAEVYKYKLQRYRRTQ
jgi:hypothetical protein